MELGAALQDDVNLCAVMQVAAAQRACNGVSGSRLHVTLLSESRLHTCSQGASQVVALCVIIGNIVAHTSTPAPLTGCQRTLTRLRLHQVEDDAVPHLHIRNPDVARRVGASSSYSVSEKNTTASLVRRTSLRNKTSQHCYTVSLVCQRVSDGNMCFDRKRTGVRKFSPWTASVV